MNVAKHLGRGSVTLSHCDPTTAAPFRRAPCPGSSPITELLRDHVFCERRRADVPAPVCDTHRQLLQKIYLLHHVATHGRKATLSTRLTPHTP